MPLRQFPFTPSEMGDVERGESGKAAIYFDRHKSVYPPSLSGSEVEEVLNRLAQLESAFGQSRRQGALANREVARLIGVCEENETLIRTLTRELDILKARLKESEKSLAEVHHNRLHVQQAIEPPVEIERKRESLARTEAERASTALAASENGRISAEAAVSRSAEAMRRLENENRALLKDLKSARDSWRLEADRCKKLELDSKVMANSCSECHQLRAALQATQEIPIGQIQQILHSKDGSATSNCAVKTQIDEISGAPLRSQVENKHLHSEIHQIRSSNTHGAVINVTVHGGGEVENIFKNTTFHEVDPSKGEQTPAVSFRPVEKFAYEFEGVAPKCSIKDQHIRNQVTVNNPVRAKRKRERSVEIIPSSSTEGPQERLSPRKLAKIPTGNSTDNVQSSGRTRSHASKKNEGDVILARITDSGKKDDASRLRRGLQSSSEYGMSPSVPEALRMSTRRSTRSARK